MEADPDSETLWIYVMKWWTISIISLTAVAGTWWESFKDEQSLEVWKEWSGWPQRNVAAHGMLFSVVDLKPCVYMCVCVCVRVCVWMCMHICVCEYVCIFLRNKNQQDALFYSQFISINTTKASSNPILLAASKHKRKTHITCRMYIVVPPDEDQQTCSKHVEVNYWNKLEGNSASCWCLLHLYFTMYSSQNVKYACVFVNTYMFACV